MINVSAINYTQEVKFKSCNICENSKPASYFYKNKKTKDRLSNKCKDCAKSYQSKYYTDNREASIEYKKHYRQENTDKIKDARKKYYKENIEKIREKQRILSIQYYKENVEKIREYQKKYNQTEAGKAKSSKSDKKRRALKAGAEIENFMAQEVFNRDRYKCQSCGIKTRPDYKNKSHSKYPNLDHIVPLSKGGDHSKLNTQCLCRKCNLAKGNRYANDQMLLIG